MGSTGNTAYRQDIYLIRADGTGLRRLTKLSASNISPAWSPDGKRIVFASSRAHAGERGGEQVMDIYVMNANGTQPKQLTRTPFFQVPRIGGHGRSRMGRAGIEPATLGLKVPCSTN